MRQRREERKSSGRMRGESYARRQTGKRRRGRKGREERERERERDREERGEKTRGGGKR